LISLIWCPAPLKSDTEDTRLQKSKLLRYFTIYFV